MGRKRSESVYVRKSQEFIEAKAVEARRRAGIDSQRNANIDNALAKLSNEYRFRIKTLRKAKYGFINAWFDPKKRILYITDSLQLGIRRNWTKSREIVAEEIGHIVLGHPEIVFSRDYAQKRGHSTYEDEARRFAAAFLVAADLVDEDVSGSSISNRFGVSKALAGTRSAAITVSRNLLAQTNELQHRAPTPFRESILVCMPFSKRMGPVYDVIKWRVERLGFNCVRADEVPTTETIMEKFERLMDECAFAIVVLTGLNPNVMYEVGRLDEKRKEVILVCDQAEGKPFPIDLAHLNRIIYTDNFAGGGKFLLELEDAIGSVVRKYVLN